MAPRVAIVLPSSVDHPTLHCGLRHWRRWIFDAQRRPTIRSIALSHRVRLLPVLCDAYGHKVRIRLDAVASPPCERMGGAQISTVSMNYLLSHAPLFLPKIPG